MTAAPNRGARAPFSGLAAELTAVPGAIHRQLRVQPDHPELTAAAGLFALSRSMGIFVDSTGPGSTRRRRLRWRLATEAAALGLLLVVALDIVWRDPSTGLSSLAK